MSADSTKDKEPKAHPFEEAGMGLGPYKWVGMYSLPSSDLAEKNPSAYQEALREMPKLKGGCGTCYACGMAIIHICIVADRDGVLYGVGTDCVEKTEDPHLGNAAKLATAKRLKEIRRQKREEKWHADRAAYLEENKDRLAAEQTAREEKEAARLRAIEARLDAIGRPVVKALEAAAQTSEFFESLHKQIVSEGSLSPRQAQFVAKLVLGRRSKKNETEFDALVDRISNRNQ